MDNASSSYAVLRADTKAHDPMALAKALAALRKTPLQDQITWARNCWGIVAENLSGEAAETLANALSQAGVECKIGRTSSIPVLPRAEELTVINSLPSARPALIASAAITITSTTTRSVKEGPSASQKILNTGILLATGLPVHFGGKQRTVEKIHHQSDQVFYLDLIYETPSRRFRVDAQKFDYAFLKERKLYNVFGNFKLLLGDVAQASPDAWQNHGTRVLLEGKPVQTMNYNSLADLERESRWLLTLLESR